jgi:hypothetical protein
MSPPCAFIKDIIQRNSNLSRSPDTIGFFAITPATGFFPDHVSVFVSVDTNASAQSESLMDMKGSAFYYFTTDTPVAFP